MGYRCTAPFTHLCRCMYVFESVDQSSSRMLLCLSMMRLLSMDFRHLLYYLDAYVLKISQYYIHTIIYRYLCHSYTWNHAVREQGHSSSYTNIYIHTYIHTYKIEGLEHTYTYFSYRQLHILSIRGSDDLLWYHLFKIGVFDQHY